MKRLTYINPQQIVRVEVERKLENTRFKFHPTRKGWFKTTKEHWRYNTIYIDDIDSFLKSGKHHSYREEDRVYYRPRLIFVQTDGKETVQWFKTEEDLDAFIQSKEFKNLNLY